MSFQLGRMLPGDGRFALVSIKVAPNAATGSIPISATVPFAGGTKTFASAFRIASAPEPHVLTSFSGSYGGVKVRISSPLDTVARSQSVPIAIEVTNAGSADVAEADLRMVTPHGIDGYFSAFATGHCFNRNITCIPGNYAEWSLGTLRPGGSFSAVVPFNVEQAATAKAIQACASVWGVSGGSGAACLNIGIR